MNLSQSWPRPSSPKPIVVIGAGGIVNDAHLPAYRKAKLPVAGIFDVDPAKAQATTDKFGVDRVFDSLSLAVSQQGVVFDIAVPPEREHDVLAALPDESAVLMQKPMGVDLADARRIRELCRRKKLVAAVNFQLRFAPMMLAVRDAVARGLLGELVDIEFRLNVRTPWELFPWATKLDRVEIQLHSIHYLDLIRGFLGEPRGVWAQTVRHPSLPQFRSLRTSIILDYGDMTRVTLSLNHVYEFGPAHQDASVSFQGTHGAARVTLGLLLDYPRGKPETVEIATKDQPWTNVPINGQWFPDGFVGTMSNLQRFIAGEDEKLISSYEDAYKTMALVEACYTSNERGATPIPD